VQRFSLELRIQTSLLSDGYWGPFAQRQSSQVMKLTTHLCLMREVIPPHPICLHDVMLN
jgi:hypothetical protein